MPALSPMLQGNVPSLLSCPHEGGVDHVDTRNGSRIIQDLPEKRREAALAYYAREFVGYRKKEIQEEGTDPLHGQAAVRTGNQDRRPGRPSSLMKISSGLPQQVISRKSRNSPEDGPGTPRGALPFR